MVRSIRLNHPRRHNALTLDLVTALRAAVAEAAASDHVDAVVLTAAGRSFSTGGDVAEFAAREGEDRVAYARELVGALHECILELLRLEVPLVVGVHGLVTGGSLGLVLACDVVLVGPHAAFAPYYVDVGFSPDGGWTALLPDRVGRRRATAWQLTNRTVDAPTALAWGLADEIVDEPVSAVAVDRACEITTKRPAAVRRTKALLRPDLDAVVARLDAELDSFVDQIATDEATRGMAHFLRATAAARAAAPSRQEPS